jgi:uncharacterized protein YbjT (DUF2867 family)
MKIVVIGEDAVIAPTISSQLVEEGHHAIVVPPVARVDASMSDQLAEEFAGAAVVVDVTDSPSYDARIAWDFLSGATDSLLSAARQAGVTHLVALSVVGTGRLLTSGYFRAKAMREQRIAESGIPFSIVRGTQCYESLGLIADWATDGNIVRTSPALTQPIAAEDLSRALAKAALVAPVGGIRDVAGPHRYGLDEIIRAHLRAHHDTRRVRAEPQARYLGAKLDEYVLLPGRDAAVYPTDFADWLAHDVSAPAR